MQGIKVEPIVERAVAEALGGRPLADPDEIQLLLEIPLFSPESAVLQAAARQLSEQACNGCAEVHGQIALNVGSCPRDCQFCAFAASHGLFPQPHELPLDYVIAQAQAFERQGANAVYLMATAAYPFGRYLECAAEVRRALGSETLLVANVGDFSYVQAVRLREAGFSGIYHTVRLGEGEVTGIPVERRLQTIQAAREAGLFVGTSVEPVGPEHTCAQLVQAILLTRDVRPVFSGAARRIPIANTPLAPYGMISEAQMAHLLAVIRLVLPLSIAGHYTHEPSVIGAAAGANVFWAEAGANPRDITDRTEEGRGLSVDRCRDLLGEADWDCLDGPSVFFGTAPLYRKAFQQRPA